MTEDERRKAEAIRYYAGCALNAIDMKLVKKPETIAERCFQIAEAMYKKELELSQCEEEEKE